nr:Chain C, SERINE/THREONINE-PROTEIN KINASE WNK4 [Homo sapiens]4CH9_D Chain D, SERINE/THREONINE-PROTEIN KINASE WNK4 [Homo sapiens]4CHB_C Chain C, SERINE/THREONINE-PROTEIN KINASE WNK4 [Homo sapiens]4CHB_D Chain D, SERINE/THREONINE-PROTEIN KINASE WNK4 [Homo sapiens]
EPEEPEADQHQ